MIIDVAQLRETGRPLQVEVDFAEKDLRLRSDVVASPRPVHSRLNITLAGEQIRVKGSLQAALEVACSRCLTGFRQELTKDFSLEYWPDPAVSEDGEEFALSYAELTVGFYRDDRLDLSAVICEQILLEVPMKPVCRDDCKGLCEQCGVNLNEGRCDCETTRLDPRLAVLAELKNRLGK